ncbi:MAG: glycosyltransferase family 2 protein [Candidatus Hydrogenedentes bacterium]|nr:glycosyltransferase family 2 protein [Candidatus Hydrogenedentota bacterium]
MSNSQLPDAAASARTWDENFLVSVVAPVYNEAEGIEGFIAEVREHLAAISPSVRAEIVLVNDGSTDGSAALLDHLAASSQGGVRVVHLARNFGHGPAVAAGLDHAQGDVVILMDADYQDDPAAFAPLLDQWREGYDVVYVERTSRQENPLSRGVFWLFYRIFDWIADTNSPMDAGNFGLMDRRVVAQLSQLPERNRYLPGLRAWVGFRQTGVSVPRRARYDSSTRVGIRGLWTLGMNAIFSFSYVPLFVFRIAGALSIGLSALLVLYAICIKIMGHDLGTSSSILISTSFLGGINLFGVGLLGEYIARIYDEVKCRPVYVVDRVVKRDEV